MTIQFRFIWFLFCLLLAGCISRSEATQNSVTFVPKHQILTLLCDSNEDCLQYICPISELCPLMIALSHPVIFEFIRDYSTCEGCNLPEFDPEKGIGKCVEYEMMNQESVIEVRFWISESCNFRYAYPYQTRITVLVDSQAWEILHITPSVSYIQDANYCDTDSDCRCLFGSGVPFIGCANVFYAPLNWTGYFEGEDCNCVANQCISVDGQSSQDEKK